MGAVLGSLAGAGVSAGTAVGGMSMSMASCIACQACSCASSAACSYLCGKFGSGGQTPENVTKNTSRFTYFVLFLISVIASWIFRDQVTSGLCKDTGEIFCKSLVPRRPADSKLHGAGVCLTRGLCNRHLSHFPRDGNLGRQRLLEPASLCAYSAVAHQDRVLASSAPHRLFHTIQHISELWLGGIRVRGPV